MEEQPLEPGALAVGVRFRPSGPIYDFDPSPLLLARHGRELGELLRTRVEMKQIGARDETKVTGGVGPCGRELCCSSWLQEFQPVSVRMAKEQGLSLNPAKLAGMCGRLKCCLRYEYQTYVELKKTLPAVGAPVESVKGDGTVVRQNVLRQTVVVRRSEDNVEVEATRDDLVVRRADA